MDLRLLTAYHEAGHAVAALLCGRLIHKVSILPKKTRLGACEMKKGRSQPSDDWLEDEVIILFAGAVAEARVSGHYQWGGAAQDLRDIRRLTKTRAGDEARAERLERRLLAKTEHLLSDDATWQAVDSVAAKLLEHETIKGRMVVHLHQQCLQRSSQSR